MPRPNDRLTMKTLSYESRGKFHIWATRHTGRIPANEGKTVVWKQSYQPYRKVNSIDWGEQTRTPSGLSATLISATVSQYGNFEQVSDILELSAVDTLIKETIDVLHTVALSIDTVVVGALSGGGTASDRIEVL